MIVETDAADLGPSSSPNAGFFLAQRWGVVAAVQRVQRGMGFGSGCSSSGHAGGLMVTPASAV